MVKSTKNLIFMKKIIIKPEQVVVGIIVADPTKKGLDIHYYHKEDYEELTNLLTKKDL